MTTESKLTRRVSLPANRISRQRFLKLLLAGAAFAPAAFASEISPDRLRGDRVGWARLKTPSPHWKRHGTSDPTLTKFFRDGTTLNIDPVWYSADANSLSELCRYPLLFSQGVGVITDRAGRSNLAEYIRRGGFLLVDACHDTSVTPDYEAFLRVQIQFYSEILPEARLLILPKTHGVFNCHFNIPNGHPPHTFMNDVYDARKAQHGLYGVMMGGRLVGIISLCGWQCGWDHTEYPSPSGPGTDLACMRMVVNIYIYAMTQ